MHRLHRPALIAHRRHHCRKRRAGGDFATVFIALGLEPIFHRGAEPDIRFEMAGNGIKPRRFQPRASK